MRAATLVIVAFVLMVIIGITALWFINRPHHQRVAEVGERLRSMSAEGARFDTSLTAGLPEAARTFLHRALGEADFLPRRIELTMRGEIRTSADARWMPFTGRQVLVRGAGFLWEAEIDMGTLFWLKGADYYYNRDGRVWFSLNSLIPVVTASGPSVSRSAAGRVLIETILVPSGLLPLYGAEWLEPDENGNLRVRLELDGQEGVITLETSPDGRLLGAVMPRVQGDEQGREVVRPFGVALDEEMTFDGVAIPTRITAGWEPGTDNYFEFFIAEITAARFF